MAECTVTKRIEASPQRVFDIFADIERVPERVSGIKKLEKLTPGPVGVGTRFRETRVMFGKEATEEMYFSAFEPPNRYEVKCESHGAEYRSVYAFRPDGNGTMLEMLFEAKPVSFFAKLMTPLAFLFMGSMRKCMERDIDDLKKVAEANATATRTGGSA